ncbi:hypothetical protein H5410_064270 [Solanum commersonii]|uniref:Uncharacterized protein n=1 Tax=Solanum commersonii TaxID=4109 RepID=A0A9J5W011_SOLCO|nr:hypothetical protein H5410_064270 [Solanum commersonii]
MADFQRSSLADRDIDQAIAALKKGANLLKYGREKTQSWGSQNQSWSTVSTVSFYALISIELTVENFETRDHV